MSFPTIIEIKTEEELKKNIYLLSTNDKKFIYRGQTDSAWELVPSLLRKDISQKLLGKYPIPFRETKSVEDLYYAEISQYFEYYRYKNSKGHTNLFISNTSYIL
ncbi:MAG: hypothetical protein Ta2B_13430 [Termitinemataceae bacterium]|nr:MAG: hypothetical protein Ta2B_13430 [Termitinemataceae bacterium]